MYVNVGVFGCVSVCLTKERECIVCIWNISIYLYSYFAMVLVGASTASFIGFGWNFVYMCRVQR